MWEGRPPGDRPRGLPESPIAAEQKARIAQIDALTELYEKLTALAALGASALEQLLAEAAEDKAERERARQRAQELRRT